MEGLKRRMEDAERLTSVACDRWIESGTGVLFYWCTVRPASPSPLGVGRIGRKRHRSFFSDCEQKEQTEQGEERGVRRWAMRLETSDTDQRSRRLIGWWTGKEKERGMRWRKGRRIEVGDGAEMMMSCKPSCEQEK